MLLRAELPTTVFSEPRHLNEEGALRAEEPRRLNEEGALCSADKSAASCAACCLASFKHSEHTPGSHDLQCRDAFTAALTPQVGHE